MVVGDFDIEILIGGTEYDWGLSVICGFRL